MEWDHATGRPGSRERAPHTASAPGREALSRRSCHRSSSRAGVERPQWETTCMPELPDVEAYRRFFAEHAPGRKIEEVWVDPTIVRNTTPEDLQRTLGG